MRRKTARNTTGCAHVNDMRGSGKRIDSQHNGKRRTKAVEYQGVNIRTARRIRQSSSRPGETRKDRLDGPLTGRALFPQPKGRQQTAENHANPAKNESVTANGG